MDNIHQHFRHLYDPLKEKILKKNANETALRLMSYFLLYSSYKLQIQQFFFQELESNDKRSQLATVIVLQFLYDNHLVEEDMSQFVPALIHLTYTKTPTILACASAELVLNICKYALTHTEHDSSKIVEVEDISVSFDWKNIDALLNNLETVKHGQHILALVKLTSISK